MNSNQKVSVLLEFVPGQTMGTRSSAQGTAPYRVLLLEGVSDNDVARSNAMQIDQKTHLATEQQIVSILGDVGWKPVSTQDGALDVPARVIAHLLGKAASGLRTRDVLSRGDVVDDTIQRLGLAISPESRDLLVRALVSLEASGAETVVPPEREALDVCRLASIVLADRSIGWACPVYFDGGMHSIRLQKF